MLLIISAASRGHLFSPPAYLKEADSPGITRVMSATTAMGEGEHYVSDVTPVKGVSSGGAVYFPSQSDDAFLESEGGVMDEVLDNPPTFPVYNRRTVSSLFLPDNLREFYQARAMLYREEVPANDPRYKEIPKQYHSMKPLDNISAARNSTGSLGYVTNIYKVISASDGLPYALRRVDGSRVRNDVAMSAVSLWSRVSHSNVIPLKEAYVSNGALFFLHDFVPGSQSLRERYLDRRGNIINEMVIWSVFAQVLSAIRAVHRANMACRCISVNRILFTGHNRYCIICVLVNVLISYIYIYIYIIYMTYTCICIMLYTRSHPF
jgi:hypothetical protein